MKKRLIMLLVGWWAFSGCVVGSIHPFYTPERVLEKPELYGRWDFDESAKPQPNSQMILSAGKVTIFDETGKPLDAKITFFHVEDSLFADIYPDKGELKAELVGDLTPVHLLALIKPDGDRIKFYELDYTWLSKEVESKRIKIRYTKAGAFTDLLFTPESTDWIEFLKTYRNDPKAFPAESEGLLIRKPEFLQSKPE